MTAGALVAHQRVVGGLIVATALVTAGLGVHYRNTHSAGRLDRAIDGHLEDQLASHGGVMQRLVDTVDPRNAAILCVIVAAIFLALGRRRVAALALLGPAASGALVDFVLKPLFDRRHLGQLSFPSGHTTAAMSIAVVVVVAMLGPSHPRWPFALRAFIGVLAVVGAGAVAVALIGEGYHYATDTIGGVTIAIASVLSVALVIDATAPSVRTVNE